MCINADKKFQIKIAVSAECFTHNQPNNNGTQNDSAYWKGLCKTINVYVLLNKVSDTLIL